MKAYIDDLKKKFYLSSQVSILDNNQMLIENCKNILECNENLVRIMSNSFEIEVWGSDLKLSNYASKSVMIYGKIQSVEIKERRKSVENN